MSKRLDAFELMIARGSQDPFVHYARAMELRSLGRLDDSLAAYAAVTEAFPDYVPTYLMAAQVAQDLERVAVAREYCERGLVAARRASDGHAASELSGFLATLG